MQPGPEGVRVETFPTGARERRDSFQRPHFFYRFLTNASPGLLVSSLTLRPDITVMVDWALKTNYLSIYPSNILFLKRDLVNQKPNPKQRWMAGSSVHRNKSKHTKKIGTPFLFGQEENVHITRKQREHV